MMIKSLIPSSNVCVDTINKVTKLPLIPHFVPSNDDESLLRTQTLFKWTTATKPKGQNNKINNNTTFTCFVIIPFQSFII